MALAQSLESDLSRISDWGKKWQVSLNSEKTKVLSANRYVNPEATPISLNGTTLEESSSIRLVGLTVSKDLTWNEYILSVAKKASMKVGSLYRARRCLSPEIILHLYKSLIRPCMEYCCHIWAGASATVLNMLDRIQRRVIYMVGQKLSSNLQSLTHIVVMLLHCPCFTDIIMACVLRSFLHLFLLGRFLFGPPDWLIILIVLQLRSLFVVHSFIKEVSSRELHLSGILCLRTVFRRGLI